MSSWPCSIRTRNGFFGSDGKGTGDQAMKVMIRKDARGKLSAYVPKKDLEEAIVSMENPDLWGGIITLSNGWQLQLPAMVAGTTLPITVEARRVGGAE